MENELNYQLIGQRFRALRKKRKLTQERLSEAAGISAQHLSGIETGSAKVSLSTLVRLCNALDVTPDDVLMDSVRQAGPLLSKDIEAIFSDCTSDEIYLMLSQAKSVKDAVRLKGLLTSKE